MKKYELLHALEGFMDETDIVLRFDHTNEIRDIHTVNYVKPSLGEPAFVCLVVRGSVHNPGTSK